MFQIVLHVRIFNYLIDMYVCSFVVPFDEEDKEKDVWFLDHEYLESMFSMFRKVNGKENRKKKQQN